MIALDEIVASLSVDVSDVVKIWIIAMIDFANDASIGLRFVGHNRHGPGAKIFPLVWSIQVRISEPSDTPSTNQ
jgi:hypothetical protein|tara:strand:- start:42912 stop:43133 length:222 start_codon:yes stop_codon:yes gene_type:complete